MAYTQTIYVKKTGNDTNGTGTIDNPYLTIAKAVAMITTTTPIIYVDKGDFYISTIQSLSKSGKVITIKGQGKDTLIYTQVITQVNFVGQLELIDFTLGIDPVYATTAVTFLIYATDTILVNFRNIFFKRTNGYPSSAWMRMTGNSATGEKNKNFYNCTFNGAIPVTSAYGSVSVYNCATEHTMFANSNFLINNTNTLVSAILDENYKLTNGDNDVYGLYSGDYTWYTDRFLFYSNGKYYSIDETNTIVETVFNETNIATVGFKINKLLSSTILSQQMLKDISPFKLITIGVGLINQENIQVNGLKSTTELIISKKNVSTKLAQSVIKFLMDKTLVANGNIKVVVSTDSMTTWKTWNGTSWVNLTNTIVNKPYNDITAEEKTQWETFKNEIVSSGIPEAIIESADFNTIGATNLRFAFVLVRPTYTDDVVVKNLKMNYLAKDTYQLLSTENDLSINVNEDFVKINPLRDINSTVKVNILT